MNLCAALAAWCLAQPTPPAHGQPPAPPYPSFEVADRIAYRVERVVDANTIEVFALGSPATVDLLGVRIPPSEATRAAAVAALERLLLGEQVFLFADDLVPPGEEEERDRDLPAHAYAARAPDGLLANLELIRQGYCKVDAHPDFGQRPLFEAYEQRARVAGKGLWNPNPPRLTARAALEAENQPAAEKPAKGKGEMTVYVTRSGKKYHLKECKHCTASARPVPISEAAAKYGPCGVCKPPAVRDP